MPNDDDPPSDDPFFSDDVLYGGNEFINAWEIDEQRGWLREHGYGPGDTIDLTWEDADGTVTQREIKLPDGDWRDPDTWGDYYDDMREFYEDLWGDGEGYEGSATAG